MLIGIVGTENSHVDHIVEYLNRDNARPGTRVAGLAGGDPAHSAALADAGQIEHVVATVDELLPIADALIVTDRHGGFHREHALPFVEAGRPVLIDKPLACDVADARAILDAAERSGALVTSYSTLRYLPDTEKLVANLDSLGPLQTVVVSGPADPDSEYGGIFFYGIHTVDVALRLAPGAIGPVRVHPAGASAVATTTTSAGVHVAVHFIKPGPNGARVPFHALAIGQGALTASELGTPGNYVSYGLDVFLDMLTTGRAPLGHDQLLRPVEFLSQVRNAL
jgi:predicted dehydrogenase